MNDARKSSQQKLSKHRIQLHRQYSVVRFCCFKNVLLYQIWYSSVRVRISAFVSPLLIKKKSANARDSNSLIIEWFYYTEEES